MNQNQSKSTVSLKEVVYLTVLLFSLFFLLQLFFAYLLLQIPQFERYYEVTSYASVLILTLVIAAFSRVNKHFSPAQALLTAALFSALVLVVGLICTMGKFSIIPILIKCALMLVLAPLMAILFAILSKKKRRQRKLHFQR